MLSSRDQDHEVEDGEEDDDFLAWARIIGQGGDDHRADSPPSNNNSVGNHHRRLGDNRINNNNDDDSDVADSSAGGGNNNSSGLSQRLHDVSETRRNNGGGGGGSDSLGGLPRLREAIRTYRPNNPRYLPHHMRRQRAGREEELEVEEEAADQRLFLRAAPRVVRRSDNVRPFR